MLRGLYLHYLSMEEEGGDIFTVYGCWIEVVDTAGVALGVGFGSSSFAFWLRESARLPVLCRARLAFEVCKQWAHAWYSLLFGCLGIRCNVGMSRALNIQNKNVHYRGGRFLYQWVPRWPVTIQKLPCITVVAGSCTDEYQGGQLPSKNYCALPWWPVPVPMSTKVASYHPIITVHYRGGWIPR